MNRKKLPLILMLLAGSITSIMTFMLDYSMKDMLFAILIVLIIFGSIGLMIKNLLDYFDKQNEKRAEEEGEVIEKEPDSKSESDEENDKDSKVELKTDKESKSDSNSKAEE